ncbi:tRNA (adenosine(37)-N6)-dimethylallyltransferase MiaA, partial [Parabacteroides sp. OttesenSCG-928-G21]|nr:tRNA (adenosine(37)-N6)-dimethylallyltransferase MiaA [Parabacteroides sp. OttesenSCG-928-G21]
QHDFHKAYQAIREKGKLPVLCGGTGMYIEAVLKGYKLLDVPQNPELRESLKGKTLQELEAMLASYKALHNKTDVDSAQRAIRAIEIEEYYRTQAPDVNEYAPINSLIVGVNIDRELRRRKITKRLHTRLEEGMIAEVEQILATGVKPEELIYYGLEYKYLTLYITGQLSYDEMVSQLEIAIHQFAKRQMTWFRGMERRGFHIHWIDALLPIKEKIETIYNLLDN